MKNSSTRKKNRNNKSKLRKSKNIILKKVGNASKVITKDAKNGLNMVGKKVTQSTKKALNSIYSLFGKKKSKKSKK